MFYNYLLLIVTTMIWGMGFVATKWVLQSYPPFWAHGLRYIVAGIACLPFLFWQKSFSKNWLKIKLGFIGGALLSVSMILQTLGLVHTTVAKSGFITTAYVFFLPLICVFLYKQKFNKWYWPLVCLGFVGIIFLNGLDLSQLNKGDFLTLLCAICFAVHILFIDYSMKYFKSGVEFNSLQCFFGSFISVFCALAMEGPLKLDPFFANGKLVYGYLFWGLIFTGVFSSFIAFSIQSYSQKRIAPHIIGPILLLESPFAAVFGHYLMNERLTLVNVIGCVLVLISVALIPMTATKSEIKSHL